MTAVITNTNNNNSDNNNNINISQFVFIDCIRNHTYFNNATNNNYLF